MEEPFFTVYTPTYNRAHTLERCYESLLVQSCRDFEWLIVDDGSTDGTDVLVGAWQAEKQLPSLRYVSLAHGGAHIAHNRSLELARGKVVIKLDSDDACVPEALERFLHHWESLSEAEKPHFAGVTALCRDQEGRSVGDTFPKNPLDCTAAELDYQYSVRGEKWGFVRLDLLKQFPYPEDCSGSFVPESYVWAQISQKWKTRHVNEVLRIYWTDAPSLVHGRPQPARHADGHRRMFGLVLNLESRFFWTSPGRLLRVAVQFVRFSLHHGEGLRAQWRALHPGFARILWAVAYPLGFVLWARDRLCYPGKAKSA